MSDLSTVRTFISDNKQYGVADAVGDGVSTEFLFPNAPIYPSSAVVYLDGTPSVAFTIDEALGLITMNTAPLTGVVVKITAKFTFLSDDQITSALDMFSTYDSNSAVKLGAADCLDIIASSEAMIQKKLEMLDFKVDGPALAKSLRDHALSLRKSVLGPDLIESDFVIAEMVYDGPGLREKIIKDWMREDS